MYTVYCSIGRIKNVVGRQKVHADQKLTASNRRGRGKYHGHLISNLESYIYIGLFFEIVCRDWSQLGGLGYAGWLLVAQQQG